MDFETRLRVAIYDHFVAAGGSPSVEAMATELDAPPGEILRGLQRLADSRLLVLESDQRTLRMAPPFSGIETQHRVRVGEREYYANCAWDALGVPAALHRDAEILSRCEQSLEPLRIVVSGGAPEAEPCLAHFAVAAADWWDDIVYT